MKSTYSSFLGDGILLESIAGMSPKYIFIQLAMAMMRHQSHCQEKPLRRHPLHHLSLAFPGLQFYLSISLFFILVIDLFLFSYIDVLLYSYYFFPSLVSTLP